MIEIKRKRRPHMILGIEKLKNILKYRARGYTLESIARKFHLGSRQKVNQIIKKHKNKPELTKLYKEIDRTYKFLNRKF